MSFTFSDCAYSECAFCSIPILWADQLTHLWPLQGGVRNHLLYYINTFWQANLYGELPELRTPGAAPRCPATPLHNVLWQHCIRLKAGLRPRWGCRKDVPTPASEPPWHLDASIPWCRIVVIQKKLQVYGRSNDYDMGPSEETQVN